MIYSSIEMMCNVGLPETLVNFYQTTQRYILEDGNYTELLNVKQKFLAVYHKLFFFAKNYEICSKLYRSDLFL